MGDVIHLAFKNDRPSALTRRQLKALHFIQCHVRDHGCWPTRMQLGDALHIKTRLGASFLVNQLIRANAIAEPAS